MFVVEAASLSALAVTGVLLYIGVNKVAAFCAWPSQYGAVMNKNPQGHFGSGRHTFIGFFLV